MEHEKDPGWQYLKRSREQMLEVRLLFHFPFSIFYFIYY